MPRARKPTKRNKLATSSATLMQVRAASARLLICAQTLYQGVAAGLPDSGARQVQDALAGFDEAQGGIAHEALLDLCARLRTELIVLISLDAEALELVASYLGRLPLDREKLERYLGSKRFAADYPAGPTWVAAPEYRAMRRRALAAFDTAWLLDQQIAAQVSAIVEAEGGSYQETEPSMARPVEQLRGAIEALRQEIKGFGELGELVARGVAGIADLSSDTDKDTTTP